MNVAEHPDTGVSRIAAAIGEPARARILYALMDGQALTSTELAVVAEVSASTASVHLNRLRAARLVRLLPQGRHRYYRLEGPGVAKVLESLSVLAGRRRRRFVPGPPGALRHARTCYDHLAGALGVALLERLLALKWLSGRARSGGRAYDLTPTGAEALAGLGIDLAAARALRRRFAYACLDWSERRSHLGGALAGALLTLALDKAWLARHLDSRALDVTAFGRRELLARLGLRA